MPRISKDDLVNDLLSGRRLEQEAMEKPIPDSAQWWQQVAEGLGVTIHKMRLERDAAVVAASFAPAVCPVCKHEYDSHDNELLAALTRLESANDKMVDGWDAWREARIVCEAIGSGNGVGTIASALFEAFDAGRVFEARSIEDDWIRIATQNADDANARYAALEQATAALKDRLMLRSRLEEDGGILRDELQRMTSFMESIDWTDDTSATSAANHIDAARKVLSE